MNKPRKTSSAQTAPALNVHGQAAGTEFLLYETEDGRTRVECRFVDDSLWLPQALMAELFQTSKQNISLHVKNVLAEGELQAAATVKDYLTVQTEGTRQVRRKVQLYNLDMILAVGYRVKSPRGTQFRRWATERLGEYLLKGFTMDDERLKNPPVGDSALPDRFGELLERIRDIRASERRMYLRVREIFALAADYAPTLPETTAFFRIIQNKLHYAVSGQTAAEIIRRRADHSGFVRQDEKYSRFMAGKSVENYIALDQGEFAYNKGNSKSYEFGCVFSLNTYERGLVPNVYVCFKLLPNLNTVFYEHLFRADFLHDQLGALVNTGVRNNGLLNIKPVDFLACQVPVPPLDVQHRIAEVLTTAAKWVALQERDLELLKQEKAALMSQLLTGKRRVKLQDIETEVQA